MTQEQIKEEQKKYAIEDITPDKNTWLYDVESFAQTFMVTYKKANKKEYVIFLRNGPSDNIPDFVKRHCITYCQKRLGKDAKIDIRPVSQLPAFYQELAKNKGVVTGFNNSSYDSNIVAAALCNYKAKNLCQILHEINEDLVTKGMYPWQSPACKKYIKKDDPIIELKNKVVEPDLMLDLVEFFGLKRTQNSIGENIEETSVPFDIPLYTANKDKIKKWFETQKERGVSNIEKLVDKNWLTLTPEGLAETMYYNISDTNQTNRVLSFRYGWYKTKLQVTKGITNVVNNELEVIVPGSIDMAHKTNASSSEAAFYHKKYGTPSAPLPATIRFDSVWLSPESDYHLAVFKAMHNYFNSQPIFLRDRRPNEDITKSTSKKYHLLDPQFMSKYVVPVKIEPHKLNFYPEQIDNYSIDTEKYNKIKAGLTAELLAMNANYWWEVQKMSDPKAKEKGEFFIPESVLRWRLYNDANPISDFAQFGHNLKLEYDLDKKKLLDPKEQELNKIKQEIAAIKKQIPPKFTKTIDGETKVYYLTELEGMEDWEKPFDPIYKNINDGTVVSEKERLSSDTLKRSIKVSENSSWIKTPSFNKNERKLLYGARTVLWNFGEPMEQLDGFGGIHSAILSYIYKPTDSKSWLKNSQNLFNVFNKQKQNFKSPKDYDKFFEQIDELNKTKGYEFQKNQKLNELVSKYGSIDAIPAKEYEDWKTKYYETCIRFNNELNQFRFGKVSTVDVASLYPSILALRAKRLYPNDKNFQAGLYADLKKLRVALKKTNADVAAVLKIWLNGYYGRMLYPNGKAFSPQGQFGIVAEGQEALLKLKDMLFEHIKEIQSNTDGLYFHPRVGHEEICKKIHGYDYVDKDGKKIHVQGEWEKLTGLDLEFEEHDFIIQSDVNNYLMGNIDENGKIDEKSIKSKGFFSSWNWIEKYHKALKNFNEIKDKNDVIAQLDAFDKVGLPMQFLSKNSMTIVNRATALALLYDKDPMEIIKAETDPLYFQQLIKLSSKYDYLQQNGQNLHFKENRIIATKSNTGAIYKFKKGEPTKFPAIYETSKQGSIKFIKGVDKLYNNWIDEKTFNVLNNPDNFPEIVNEQNFTKEEIELIKNNVWSDDLITKYTAKEQEVLEPEEIESKQELIDLFDKFEEVLVDSYDKSEQADDKKKKNSANILKQEFINEVAAGKVAGIEQNKDGSYIVNVGFIKSIYQNTPENGGVLCYKTKDPITKKEWKIENGYLVLPDGQKHKIDYDFYCNLVMQRLYAINPKKYLTPENIKKYKPDGKNKDLLKDIDQEIINAKKRLESVKSELEAYQEWKQESELTQVPPVGKKH